MKKTAGAAKKAQQVREKRAPYARTPRATARSARRVRADAPLPASPQEKASRTIELHGTQVPDDVLKFCEKEGILQYLLVSDGILTECFPNLEAVGFRLQVDPETGEEAVIVDVTLRGGVEEVLDQSRSYTARWVERVPWPENSKICISYDLV